MFYNELVEPRRSPKTEILKIINKGRNEKTVDRPVTTGKSRCGDAVTVARSKRWFDHHDKGNVQRQPLNTLEVVPLARAVCRQLSQRVKGDRLTAPPIYRFSSGMHWRSLDAEGCDLPLKASCILKSLPQRNQHQNHTSEASLPRSGSRDLLTTKETSMNLTTLLGMLKSKQTINRDDLIKFIKESSNKTYSVRLSNDQKNLIIEMKVWSWEP